MTVSLCGNATNPPSGKSETVESTPQTAVGAKALRAPHSLKVTPVQVRACLNCEESDVQARVIHNGSFVSRPTLRRSAYESERMDDRPFSGARITVDCETVHITTTPRSLLVRGSVSGLARKALYHMRRRSSTLVVLLGAGMPFGIRSK